MNFEKGYPIPMLEKLGLPEVAIPILLFSYKYGIAEIPSDINVLKRLDKLGFAKVNIARGKSLCMLTDKGADWVDANLLEILSTIPISLTYSALVPGDEIQLMKDINESNKFDMGLGSPAIGMDRGRYFLNMINKGIVTLVDDLQVPYRLNVNRSANILQFRPDQLGPVEEEIKKRFHPIRIKSLTKRLYENISTLTLTEWVEELYDRKHTKWRMGT